jgi:hypothetical protein
MCPPLGGKPDIKTGVTMMADAEIQSIVNAGAVTPAVVLREVFTRAAQEHTSIDCDMSPAQIEHYEAGDVYVSMLDLFNLDHNDGCECNKCGRYNTPAEDNLLLLAMLAFCSFMGFALWLSYCLVMGH